MGPFGNDCSRGPFLCWCFVSFFLPEKALHQVYYGKEELSHGTVSIDVQIRAAEAAKGPAAVSVGGREYENIERD